MSPPARRATIAQHCRKPVLTQTAVNLCEDATPRQDSVHADPWLHTVRFMA